MLTPLPRRPADPGAVRSRDVAIRCLRAHSLSPTGILRRSLLAGGLAVLLALTAVTGAAHADAPDPQPLPPTGNCTLDNIYYGAIPPGGDDNPVIVFVHGYGGLAEDWWFQIPLLYNNDSYQIAYDSGYRTAFVNLNVDPEAENCAVVRTPAKSFVYNGFVLAQQLTAITQHYDVRQVDIVAHSKGGVDAQAAIVIMDSAPKVRNVFTLSSPHQGSLLADLLWRPEGSWMVGLLFDRDEATYSMQTAQMQAFRAIADASEVDDSINYYSASGDGWRNGGLGLRITGQWLEEQPTGGPNDGGVTVASTWLPYASVLFRKELSHDQMAFGRNYFPDVLAVLSGQRDQPPTQVVVGAPPMVAVNAPVRVTATGGPLTATKPFTFHWRPSELPEQVRTTGVSDAATFTWTTTGTKTVEVLVSNSEGGVSRTFTIEVVPQLGDLPTYFPFVLHQ